MTNTPKLLNLDEMELVKSDITIKWKGVDHTMATLTVEGYLMQQRRASEQLALEARVANEGVTQSDTEEMVRLLRTAIGDFFPTLPVDELETQRLFTIFGWLNELSLAVTEEAADVTGADQGESAEGNAAN